MINELRKLSNELRARSLNKEANYLNVIIKKATREDESEGSSGPEIRVVQGPVVTLDSETAGIINDIVDESFNRIGHLADSLEDEGVGARPSSHLGLEGEASGDIDPRLMKLNAFLNDAQEALYQAGLMSAHLRDGTGD